MSSAAESVAFLKPNKTPAVTICSRNLRRECMMPPGYLDRWTLEQRIENPVGPVASNATAVARQEGEVHAPNWHYRRGSGETSAPTFQGERAGAPVEQCLCLCGRGDSDAL